VQTRITKISFKLFLAPILIVLANALNPATATAATASEIDRNVTQAPITLYQTTPGTKILADSAKGTLVFSSMQFCTANALCSP
jgi:hypothetical protein